MSIACVGKVGRHTFTDELSGPTRDLSTKSDATIDWKNEPFGEFTIQHGLTIKVSGREDGGN